jgi:hypothetical protein
MSEACTPHALDTWNGVRCASRHGHAAHIPAQLRVLGRSSHFCLRSALCIAMFNCEKLYRRDTGFHDLIENGKMHELVALFAGAPMKFRIQALKYAVAMHCPEAVSALLRDYEFDHSCTPDDKRCHRRAILVHALGHFFHDSDERDAAAECLQALVRGPFGPMWDTNGDDWMDDAIRSGLLATGNVPMVEFLLDTLGYMPGVYTAHYIIMMQRLRVVSRDEAFCVLLDRMLTMDHIQRVLPRSLPGFAFTFYRSRVLQLVKHGMDVRRILASSKTCIPYNIRESGVGIALGFSDNTEQEGFYEKYHFDAGLLFADASVIATDHTSLKAAVLLGVPALVVQRLQRVRRDQESYASLIRTSEALARFDAQQWDRVKTRNRLEDRNRDAVTAILRKASHSTIAVRFPFLPAATRTAVRMLLLIRGRVRVKLPWELWELIFDYVDGSRLATREGRSYDFMRGTLYVRAVYAY